MVIIRWRHAGNMSTKGNLALVRRLYEETDKGNIKVLDEVFAPGYIDHNPLPVPGLGSGLAGLKRAFEMFTAGFKDSEHIVEDILAVGDKVIVRVTGKGTHAGEFMGVPPTGKRVSMTGIAIYRTREGKIVEKWGEQDWLGIMQQLGILPPPGSQ